MSELQPGMLALVIGYVRLPESVGKIVTLVAEDLIGIGNERCWFVSGLDDAILVRTKHLLPINPEADPLDVTHKEELHA